jgi:hypothetical protein
MAVPAYPNASRGAVTSTAADSEYAWVIIRFNFTCPAPAKTRPKAGVVIDWRKRQQRQYSWPCWPDKRRGVYAAKGAVIQIFTPLKPSWSELKITPTNCTVSPVYFVEPPEWKSEEYYKIRYS